MRRRAPLLLLLALLSCNDSTSSLGIHIDVVPNPVLLVVDDSLRLTVNALDSEGHLVTGVAVAFTSMDTSVATASNVGVIRAQKIGVTTIRVAGGGTLTDVPVTVTAVPAEILISPRDTSIGTRETAQYRGAVVSAEGDTIPGVTIDWLSMDTSIATINAAGLATAKAKAATTYIQARSGTLTAVTTLTVLDSLIAARVPLGGPAYAAAIASTGATYVGLEYASQLVRVNLSSRTVTGTVAVGSVPTEVAFNAPGSRAYVTNQSSQNVGVVNVATNVQIDLIPVTGDPFEVIVAPGDSIIYVSTNVNRVYGIRLATKDTVVSFATPAIGNGMVIRDTLLYVSTHSGGTIIEFNLRTRTVSRTLSVGGTPQKLALSADQNTLYIANQSGYVQFWNLLTGAEDGDSIPLVGSAGYGIARRPTNGLLYVTSAFFGSGDIHVIDPTSRTLVHTSHVGGSTRRVVFSATGVGIVPNESGWIDFLK